MRFTSRRRFLSSALGAAAWVSASRSADAQMMHGDMRGMMSDAGGGKGGMMGTAPGRPAQTPPEGVQPFQRELSMPPLQRPVRQSDGTLQLSLRAGAGTSELVPGRTTPTWGYNGAMLGPALVVPRDQSIRVMLRNDLPQSTTVHWHGGHVRGDVDGGPHSLIEPGATHVEELRFDQPGATLWYHPHPHGRTGGQVYAGLAGLLLIDDGADRALGLPHAWGVDDLPLIVQDRRIAADGTLLYLDSMMDVMGMQGNRFLVNGREQPFARVPAQWVRLRILNGSNARVYNLAFRDGRTFHAVASDAGLLAQPVALRELRLFPAERAEILVDLRHSEGQSLVLGSYDRPTGEAGIWRGPTTAQTDLLQLRVGPPGTGTAGRLPDALATLPPAAMGQSTHDFELGMMGEHMMSSGMGIAAGLLQSQRGQGSGPGGMNMGGPPRNMFSINRQYMDMRVINLRVPIRVPQVWSVRNSMQMNHSFHVHGTSFRIVQRNGEPPPEQERGWKDVVALAPHDHVVLALHFEQPAGDATPYMYHCHVLEHEDNGMMGQLVVS